MLRRVLRWLWCSVRTYHFEFACWAWTISILVALFLMPPMATNLETLRLDVARLDANQATMADQIAAGQHDETTAHAALETRMGNLDRELRGMLQLATRPRRWWRND